MCKISKSNCDKLVYNVKPSHVALEKTISFSLCLFVCLFVYFTDYQGGGGQLSPMTKVGLTFTVNYVLK